MTNDMKKVLDEAKTKWHKADYSKCRIMER